MPDSLQPQGLQHARLPSPSLSPGACSKSPIESVMLSNHLILCRTLLLFLQSFPESGSFPTSWLVTSGGQNIGALTSAQSPELLLSNGFKND